MWGFRIDDHNLRNEVTIVRSRGEMGWEEEEKGNSESVS